MKLCWLIVLWLLSIATIPARCDTAILYPYGTAEGDLESPRNDDGSVGPLTIDVPFPFFNTIHQSVFVNTNGGVSFERSFSQFTPSSFPMTNSPQLVAVFWADVDTTRNAGNLLYRFTDDPDLLTLLTSNIRTYFQGSRHFQARWAMVITWDRVTFFGGNSATPVNTFQMVLTTDGISSFAIFNYASLTWTTGTASGGDSQGLGGTPAQIGFDAGDGENYATVQGSGTNAVLNLDSTSNVGVPGRYVFKIDNNIDGACGPAATRLVQPRFGSNLGGKPVTLSGQCFLPSDDILCSFGGVTTEGYVLQETDQAVCIVPPSPNTRGRVPLRVSQNGGTNFTDFPAFIYLNFDPVFHVARENEDHWEDDTWEGAEAVLYDASLLPNVTQVNLDFVSFEPSGESFIIRPTRLKANVTNNGRIYLPDNLANLTEIVVSMFGVLRVTPSDSTNGIALWSEVHSAVWYLRVAVGEIAAREDSGQEQANIIMLLNPQHPNSVTSTDLIQHIRDELQSNNRAKRWLFFLVRVVTTVVVVSTMVCDAYTLYENINPTDFSDLPAPPCTYDQAVADPNFTQDPACSDGSFGCFVFHTGAYNCIRSRAPVNGKGQQACYDEEGNILPYENGGGTVDKVHYSNKFGHFVQDVLPFLACCRLSFNCDQYGDMRPTQGCEDYVPPGTGNTRGDPHVGTIDGFNYTFNAIGEFLLMSSSLNGLTVQGRMIQAQGEDGTLLDASVWGAFVMKTTNSDVVQLESFDSFIRVFVNGQEEDFSVLTVQEFQDVTIEKSADDSVLVVVTTTSYELSFHVTLTYRAMKFQLALAETYKGTLIGLLGNYNDDPYDDLRTPNGTVLQQDADASLIHREFLAWQVTEENSLFTYGPSMSYSSYQDVTFTPRFLTLDDMTQHPHSNICEGDMSCLYDLTVTDSVEFALATRNATMQQEVLRSIFTPVVSCGFPKKTTNGNVTFTKTTEGSIANYTCDDGYSVDGQSVVTCQHNGNWSDVPQCTEDVQVKLLGPARARCVVKNTAGLPHTWDGIRWYNPQGKPADDVPGIGIHKTYTAVPHGPGFWTSTLTVEKPDHKRNGVYTCEANYNNRITRKQMHITVQGCPPGLFACSDGEGCVPCPKVCNGANDCADNSDEANCNNDGKKRNCGKG